MSYAINFHVYTKSPVILSATACLLLVCLGCPSSLLPAKMESEPSPGEYRELGRQAVAENDFKTGLQLLDKAIAGDPQDGEAYYYRGVAYQLMGEYERALQDYDHAIEFEPRLAEPWVERAAIWIVRDEMEKALQDIDQALSIDSSNARAHFLKGMVDESRGDYRAAIEHYDEAVLHGWGNNWSYLESRASAWRSLGEKEKALADLNEAIRWGGDDVSASVYRNRAIVRLDLGQAEEAVGDFNRALKIDPNDAPAIYGRALAHRDLGNRAEAIADFDAYLARNPDYVEAYKERGIQRTLVEDYDGAIADLERYLGKDPDEAEAHYYLAMARHAKGDLPHATKEIDRAIDIIPDNAEYYFLRSAIRLDANNVADAGQDYDQAVFLKPELGNQRVKTRQADPEILSRRPQLFSEMDQDKQPRCLALSPDGRNLVTGGESGLMLWDVGTRLPVRRFGGNANSMAYSPDGQTVLAGHAGGATFWDPETGGLTAFVPVPNAEVDYVEFSKEGQYFGLGTHGRVLIFEGKTRQLVRTFECFAEPRPKSWMRPGPPSYRRFSFTPDERRIVATSDQGAVLWEIADGSMLKRIGDQPVYAVALSPRGDVLFLGGMGTSSLWEMGGKRLMALNHTLTIRTTDLFTKEEKKEESTREVWVALGRFSDDGSTLAATLHSREGGGGPILIDVKAGKVINEWTITTDDVALLGNGSHMIISVSNCALLVAVRDDKQPDKITGTPFKFVFQDLRSVGFSPDGESVLFVWGPGANAMVTRSSEGQIEGTAALPAILWDLRTCQEITRLEGIIGWTNTLAFDPKGEWVATGGPDGLRIWELPSGAQLHHWDQENIYSISVSPQGDCLLVGDSGSGALLLDTKTWNEVRRFEGYEFVGRPEDGKTRASSVKCAVFSPDGHQILAASSELVLLWDRETGREIRRYDGGRSDVEWVEFHPKGELFASISAGNVRLLEVATGNERWHVDTRALGTKGLEHVAFGGQGDLLIASDDERSFLLSTKDGTVIREMAQGHGIFSPDSRLILTYRGGRASLVNTRTGGEVCRFLEYPYGDVLAVTGGLYYAAPRSVLPFVSFRAGDRAFPFEQMDVIYNRPDIVAERIGVASGDLIARYRQAYRRRLERLGISEQEIGAGVDAPQVAIVSSVPLKVPATADVTLKVEVRDAQYPLKYLHVTLNGVPVQRVPIGGGKERFWGGEVTVQLGPGDNHIELRAVNQEGAGSLRQTVVVYREHSWMKETDLYIAAVGVSEYHDRKRQLQYAAKDATDMAQYFQANPGPYRQIHALALTNENATRESVVSQTRAFFKRATVNDHVILFLAGHGLLDKKLDYWFGTVDMDFDDPSSRGLSYQAIETLLTDIAPLRRLLLVDTCNAGEIDTDATQVVTVVNETQEGKISARGVRLEHAPQQDSTLRLLQTVFADLREGTGAHVLAASGGMEFALESPEWKNGVFTSAVLRAIRDKMADRNKDGYIQVSELKEFVVADVQRLTRKQQEPTARRENPRMDFVVH